MIKFLKDTIIVSTVLLFSAACAEAGNDAGRRLNVIIITLNATRADHLSVYGYARNTSSGIGKLAGKGVVFENAFSQSYWTLPSLVSLLTSTYVHVHRVYSRNNRMTEKEPTLGEILRKYGYKTAAFVGGLDTVAYYGLSRGFDEYHDETGDKPMRSLRLIVPEAAQWLRQHRKDNFFVFIQGYDVHPPFDLPAEYKDMYDKGYAGVLGSRQIDYALLKNVHGNILSLPGQKQKLEDADINHIISRYDAALTYADFWVEKLLRELEDLRLLEKTVIIITAEHGEALGDHGTFDRFGSGYLYDEILHVPLIVAAPGENAKAKRIKCPVQLIDIMPTVLDFLDIPVNMGSQGRSLFPLIKETGGPKCEEFVFSEAEEDVWAMRGTRWKLICTKGAYELYDLAVDPGEKTNRAAEEPDVVYDLVQRFSEWDKGTRRVGDVGFNKIELTDEMKKNLQKAGYW